MAEQWVLEEPDLELQYNRLSAGEIDHIERKAQGEIEQLLGLSEGDFTKELHAAIRLSKKKVVLEKSPVPYLDAGRFDKELLDALELKGVEETIVLCKHQRQRLATSMVQRDCALVELIDDQLRSGAKLFTFRGGAHEPWLRRLLGLRNVPVRCLRFGEPSLPERLVSSLTIGEQIQDVDILYYLYMILNSRKGDYEELMTLEKRARVKNEAELRSYLAKFHS